MGTPWTRDGAVRAYVVKIAPQVAGEIVSLPIADNQFVHKGDLLMLIDPRNYTIAVRQAQAAVEQAQAVADNARAEMTRRDKLNDIAVTMEERQTYVSQATTAEATYQTALANLEQARINFKRTQVRSPVNGYVTNLSAQLGNYADVGKPPAFGRQLRFVLDRRLFRGNGAEPHPEGDAATIKLMGYTPLLRGRVQGLARGINVPNSTPDASGLASVNPIFTFVRLAQRVPVRIHIDEVPDDVKLVAGMTATVQIEPYKAAPISDFKPASGNVSQADVHPASFQTLTDASSKTAPPDRAQTGGDKASPVSASINQPIDREAAQHTPPHGSPASRKRRRDRRRRRRRRSVVGVHPALGAGHAAAEAGAADLKTLQQQIAATPPSGAASADGAQSRKRASADAMGRTDTLGRPYDLFGGQSVPPSPSASISRLDPQARPLRGGGTVPPRTP